MGVFFGHEPPPASEQHERLIALRTLIERGIPCILWGEDTLNYALRVPTNLFDQQIIVPDESMSAAAAILQEGKYRPARLRETWSEWFQPDKLPLPDAVRLKHVDIPDGHPHKLYPLPQHILLLPQSYYGLDHHSEARFQSLVPPLPPSNREIRVPKWHTFMEGLAHATFWPPTGYFHKRAHLLNMIFVEYLLLYRVEYNEKDSRYSAGPLHPEERRIVSEMTTEEGIAFIDWWLSKRIHVTAREVYQYHQERYVAVSV